MDTHVKMVKVGEMLMSMPRWSMRDSWCGILFIVPFSESSVSTFKSSFDY